ncbi:MAG: beta-glucosidase [Microbacterium sp. 71-36]|uniref:glycoside hydrolase family 3 protein n=1 Tax=unclassified Microbacterium TaxID=2609290 RepID=UPI00086BC559|nr:MULTISPECIES: glycoside hydrolase family 3 N-terminal domain-containing protein [unclassified Microbacterium]MBN9212722.1 glycoside hydrolase family 3 C-terminal domain-containing protein [Microbacterium sp.]ODT39252.1 MAG: beta-glucosidase [Microbacterium sp. SCN 71-17]OJV77851.1 MAG: beta-glucosidase [Microbacterium sp. 71-36]
MTSARFLTAPDGTRFRDLNGNGVMDPYEDPRRSVDERTDDLLGRLSLEEKVGLMFQTVIEVGEDGELLETPGKISKSPTTTVVVHKNMTHFNVHAIRTARQAAAWNNALQALAETTPHGIPVTISTDPRHAFVENTGVGFAAGPFSQWPEGLGLAALDDVETVREFAEVARREYVAVGIRAALHPQIDLATEPRWGRQAQTLGQDAARVAEFTAAYLRGFQGERLGPDSVACTTKHFPGGGPQQDGEDAHFPYGREQVYPGGMFDYHLEPFREAIRRGTAGVMPYYGMPVGLELDGRAVEEVGFGYNKQIVTGLLREELGYDGVVVTDWELVNDNHVGDQVLPARAWGVEHLTASERMEKILDAGADQFGGEECVEMLLDLVRAGRVLEERIDASARRLLRVKFELGLFDDPYVDVDEAERIVGNAEFRAAGERAQARSLTVLVNEGATLPLRPVSAVYVEGFRAGDVDELGTVVADPADADLAVVRIGAPFDPRDDLFLEAWFHQGSLEFAPGLVYRLQKIAASCPLVLVVNLDRPAILTPFVGHASAIVADYGSSARAVLDALTGRVAPRGRLPIEIPRSMDAVRASREDVPSDTGDPVFPVHFGLELAGVEDAPEPSRGYVHR